MAGFSDYMAQAALGFETGLVPFPSIASRYLALFTSAPTSDAGTGGTEVSGGSYARQQIAGALTAGASFTTASTTITLSASAPAWLLALGVTSSGGTAGSGASVYDSTVGAFIGTVSSISGSTVTLTSTAAHASSGSSDTLLFSAFPQASASSGTEPSVAPANVTNGALVAFITPTASWGTVTSFAIYDAATGGNMLMWDYLGNYKWVPFSCTNASPGVLTADTTADAPANGSSVVVTSKFGGTLPTTGGSWAGLLTTANLSSATFTAGVNTTSIGGGQFRQVASQAVANNVQIYFNTSGLTLTSA